MVLRRFAAEAGIPIEIRSASWQTTWRELRAGHIRDLHLDLFYQPLNAEVVLDTPVDYTRAGGHWSIQLSPTLSIDHFPPAQGALSLELDLKHEGKSAIAKSASIDLHLHEARPLHLANASGQVSASSWTLDGWVRWNHGWSSKLDLALKNVKAASADGTSALTAKSIDVHADTNWPQAPPFPLQTKTKINLGQITLLRHDLFIDDAILSAGADFVFDGHGFPHVDISVDKPIALTATGSYGNAGAQAEFRAHGDLSELLDKRLARWLDAQAPLLRRSSARGTVDLQGRGVVDPQGQPSATAQLKLKASRVEFPSRGLFFSDVALAAPLSYPKLPDWGTVSIGESQFHSIKLKSLSLRHRLAVQGIDLSTEDENEKDHPIRQSLWGSSIDIEHLYAHVGGTQGLELTASVKGGPFPLRSIQSDLCLIASNPLNGSLTLEYPQLVFGHHAQTGKASTPALRLVGDTNLELFNGKAHLGDISVELGNVPRVSFDVDWSDLDLHAIGEWTNFGDIRGSLNGSFKNATFDLAADGPIPVSYDLTIQGNQRGGNKMSFYGRAIDNITGLLGVHQEELPGPVGVFLRTLKTFRNWVPLKAEVLGFQAKSDGQWTELKTFDPPADADEYWCDPKRHYLLCGNSFTIPLNTSGVYPLLMSSAAFHGWLADRADYFKELMKNAHNDPSTCTPLW